MPAPSLPGTPRPGSPVPPLPPTPQRTQALPQAAPEKLTRRQRAEREAVRISQQYDWERGFWMLADTLDRDNWGRLRESIEREIELGMTPEEFELMLQMRAYWHEQTHFQSPYTSRFDSLPWGLGLTLIRRLAGIPCLDEMIILIERFYAHADQVCSKRALPAFAQRLGAVLEQADPGVDLEFWLSAQEARCFSR